MARKTGVSFRRGWWRGSLFRKISNRSCSLVCNVVAVVAAHATVVNACVVVAAQAAVVNACVVVAAQTDFV